jgi:SMI1 / KNR4 family (SUKH-1)
MAVTYVYLMEDYIDFRKRAVTEDDVQEAERELRVSLPEEYRQFLIARDGPTPEPAWFQARDGRWCGPIVAFYSTWRPLGRGDIGRSPCLEHLTEYHRSDQKLPKPYVAIAQMTTHPNTLLLSTASADFGAVYAWRPLDKRFHVEQLLPVAGSFSAFLELLADPPTEVRAQVEARAERRDPTLGRPPAEDYDGPEARAWLRRNRNPAALGANHFGGTDAGRQFVDELYALGAAKVLIPENSIQKNDDEGPYADALVVLLPTDAVARAQLCSRCEQELDLPEPIDPNDPNPIYLWWD